MAQWQTNSGQVKVYKYVHVNNWNVIFTSTGSDNDYYGRFVALNSGGSIVAIFKTGNTDAVKVFETGTGTVTRTTTSTFVAVPPDLTSLAIASNNSNTTKAKAADEVTLSFTYDLGINTPQVVFKSGTESIADTSITYEGTNSDTTWTAKYTVDSADTDGAVTLSLIHISEPTRLV